jgi:hypothetical protein
MLCLWCDLSEFVSLYIVLTCGLVQVLVLSLVVNF